MTKISKRYLLVILAVASIVVGWVAWNFNTRGYCFSENRYVSNQEILDIAGEYAFRTFIEPRSKSSKFQPSEPYRNSADLLKRNPRCCEVLNTWGGKAYNRTETKPQFSLWQKIWEAGQIRWVYMEFDDPAMDPQSRPLPREAFLITAHNNCGKIFENWNGEEYQHDTDVHS